MENKLKDRLFLIILSLLLSFLIINLSSLLVIYNNNFYKKEFDKNNVYDNFENKTYVNSLSSNLINYLDNEEELADIYSETEKKHLKDVKNIVLNLKNIFYFVFVLFIIIILFLFYRKHRYSYKVFIYGPLLTFLLISILYVFSKINFPYMFESFHIMSFSNNFWLLSEDSVLINLFPQAFFVDALKMIILISFFVSLLLFLFGIYLRRQQKP